MEVVSRPPVTAEPRFHNHRARTAKLIVEYFLPICFLVAVTIALAFPLPGRVVGSWNVKGFRIVQAINNFIVFLISGLTLKTAELRSALRHWHGFVYGVLAILLITPCLGFAFKVNLLPELEVWEKILLDFALKKKELCYISL